MDIQVAEELALMLLEGGYEVFRDDDGSVKVYHGDSDVMQTVSSSPEELLLAYNEMRQQRDAGLEIIDDPRMMVRGFAMYVKNKLEELADDFVLATPVGGIRLIDYLPTRTFELVVHTMDLAKAVVVDAEPPEKGMAATLEILGQIALHRGHASDLVLAATGRGGLPNGFSVLP